MFETKMPSYSITTAEIIPHCVPLKGRHQSQGSNSVNS